MKLTGISKPILDLKGNPFTEPDGTDEQGKPKRKPLILSDILFILAAHVQFQGQTVDQKVMGHKIAQSLAIPSDEIELSSEQITYLKLAADKAGYNPHFYGQLCALLESGTNPQAN